MNSTPSRRTGHRLPDAAGLGALDAGLGELDPDVPGFGAGEADRVGLARPEKLLAAAGSRAGPSGISATGAAGTRTGVTPP